MDTEPNQPLCVLPLSSGLLLALCCLALCLAFFVPRLSDLGKRARAAAAGHSENAGTKLRATLDGTAPAQPRRTHTRANIHGGGTTGWWAQQLATFVRPAAGEAANKPNQGNDLFKNRKGNPAASRTQP